MAPIAQQIAQMVNILPEADQALALELVKKLVLAWTLITRRPRPRSTPLWSTPPVNWKPGSTWPKTPSIGIEHMAKAKKRADGRYCAQIYLGRDENGKRQYKSVYAKSPAELKEKETAVRLQLGQGLDVLAQRDSFAAWADDWLRLKGREHITCRQMDNYRRAVKLWKEDRKSTRLNSSHIA